MSYGRHSNNSYLPMGNSVDMEAARTCDEASREEQDWKDHLFHWV